MYHSFAQPWSTKNAVTDAEVENARAAIRGKLVVGIQEAVKQRRMTHTEAAFQARMARSVVTAVLNGNLNKISTDRLLRIAHRLGLKVELKISPLAA